MCLNSRAHTWRARRAVYSVRQQLSALNMRMHSILLQLLVYDRPELGHRGSHPRLSDDIPPIGYRTAGLDPLSRDGLTLTSDRWNDKQLHSSE